jgi:hypothetical protein
VRCLDSTAVIFFRTDGTAPTVNGDNTDRLGPVERLDVDAAIYVDHGLTGTNRDRPEQASVG